jgi:uncharacterized protein YjbJ (UPF0337 family)
MQKSQSHRPTGEAKHSSRQSRKARRGTAYANHIAEVIHIMNSDQLEGNWTQFKGKMREKWGKLTDNDWETVAGKKDQLLGKLQERYGYTREQAESDYDDWDRANRNASKVA